MANTTWSTTDKSAAVTLTGSNLIATSSAARGTVRTKDVLFSGKVYFEFTFNVTVSVDTAAGIASSNLPLANGIAWTSPAAQGCVGFNHSGRVLIEGIAAAANWGTVTNGTLIGVAYDITNRLIWFREGAAGLWNLSAAADPAIGSGGYFTPSSGGAYGVFGGATVGATSDQITANFGDTAFTGTVPSGFTSGFTAGATSSTYAIATQASVEHWMTVASVSSTPAQARAMVMA